MGAAAMGAAARSVQGAVEAAAAVWSAPAALAESAVETAATDILAEEARFPWWKAASARATPIVAISNGMKSARTHQKAAELNVTGAWVVPRIQVVLRERAEPRRVALGAAVGRWAFQVAASHTAQRDATSDWSRIASAMQTLSVATSPGTDCAQTPQNLVVPCARLALVGAPLPEEHPRLVERRSPAELLELVATHHSAAPVETRAIAVNRTH